MSCGRVTLSSIWRLFKSAAESSWWNTSSPGSIRMEVVNIHGRLHDRMRCPERRERGQVMDGGVPTWLRALLDANPGEPAGGLKLPPSPRPVQGVKAALTPADGTLPWVKVQPNQFPLAESRVKSSHSECGNSFRVFFFNYPEFSVKLTGWDRFVCLTESYSRQQSTNWCRKPTGGWKSSSEQKDDLKGLWELRDKCWWVKEREGEREAEVTRGKEGARARGRSFSNGFLLKLQTLEHPQSRGMASQIAKHLTWASACENQTPEPSFVFLFSSSARHRKHIFSFVLHQKL